MMKANPEPAVWFPTINAGTGTDVFTRRLVDGLRRSNIRAEITWLPHRAEYLPWSVNIPPIPTWVNVVHVNTWLHRRFLPKHLPVTVTSHLCVHDPALRPYKRISQHLYHRCWIKRMERSVLAQATCAVAVSHYTAQQTQRMFGRSGFHVIYNGVDTCRYKPIFRENPNQQFRLLFVGTLSRRKGAELLPLIMNKLGKNFTLQCIGFPEAGFSIGPLPKNMTILGYVNNEDKLVGLMQPADALLFPPRLEGLPLTVLEAQACGLPVITTYSSSLPEIVKNGGTGFLCPENDIFAFASAAEQLANDVELWRNLCREAAQRTQRRFSLEVMVQRYVEVYKAALATSL